MSKSVKKEVLKKDQVTLQKKEMRSFLKPVKNLAENQKKTNIKVKSLSKDVKILKNEVFDYRNEAKEIWRILKETSKDFNNRFDRIAQETKEYQRQADERQKQADERQKQADERQKQADERQKQAQRQADERQRKNDEQIQKLTKDIKETHELVKSYWGGMVESHIAGDLFDLLNGKNIKVSADRISQNVRCHLNGRLYEFDFIAENGKEVVLLEAKTKLQLKDIVRFIEKITLYKKYSKDSKKLIYGAMAAVRIDKHLQKAAENRGLIVIRISGNKTTVISSEEAKHFS